MKLILFLLTFTAAVAADWALVRNADNAVLRIEPKPAGWAPGLVAHKFGTNFAARFVLVENAARPTNDTAIYAIVSTNVVGDSVLTRRFVPVRLATTNIVLNLREEAERRVEKATQSRDAIAATLRWLELHEKRLNGGVLTANETNQVVNIRAAFNRAKAIRAYQATLESNAATITTTEGWPE